METQIITFGQLAGFALVILVIFIGFTLLYHGWPKKRKKQ
jgi:hypothetical protein